MLDRGWYVGAIATVVVGAAGCGPDYQYPDTSFVVITDAGIDAEDVVDEADVPGGPAQTCALFAGSTAGQGVVDCEMPGCGIDVGLDPGNMVERLRWLPCAAGASRCTYLASPTDGVWRSVSARYTDHGPVLWLQSVPGNGSDSISRNTWVLTPADGPAAAMYTVHSGVGPFTGLPDCTVTASSVGTQASGLEITDRTVRRSVFFHGPNVADAAWDGIYAQAWTRDVELGGTLAATPGALYLGAYMGRLERVASGAGLLTIVDPDSYWEQARDNVLMGVDDAAVYMPFTNSQRMEIRAVVDGMNTRTLLGTSADDAGVAYPYATAANPSTLAWLTDRPAIGTVWHSPLSTMPGGLIPTASGRIPRASRIYGLNSSAVGFGRFLFCDSTCSVVRLSDGALFDVPSGVGIGAPRALWVGPDEIGLGFDEDVYSGSNAVGVMRVPFSALVPR